MRAMSQDVVWPEGQGKLRGCRGGAHDKEIIGVVCGHVETFPTLKAGIRSVRTDILSGTCMCLQCLTFVCVSICVFCFDK